MPLLLWVSARAAAGTWRAPASPRSWTKTSAAWATPVGPSGWPHPGLRREDDGRRAVGDRRAHEQAQRRRDHPRAEDLVERGPLVEVRARVLGGVGVVLHAHHRELLLGRAVLGHVALGGEREAG